MDSARIETDINNSLSFIRENSSVMITVFSITAFGLAGKIILPRLLKINQFISRIKPEPQKQPNKSTVLFDDWNLGDELTPAEKKELKLRPKLKIETPFDDCNVGDT